MFPNEMESNHNSKRKSDVGDDPDSNKRVKLTRDGLSELPDLALVHILSFLYTEEAAKTSVLSKRFNSLWNSVDSLSFSNKFSGKDGLTFISLVDSALLSHQRKFIEKFQVKFDYMSTYKKSVDCWLNFAVRKQVKSIHLNFNEKLRSRLRNVPEFKYTLPKALYRNENVVELVTSCCEFPKRRKISCSRLKLLSITQARLNDELISEILGGCSVLETLELRDCTGFTKLKINLNSLRVLRIVGVLGEQFPNQWVSHEDCVMEISGPNLVSLEVSGILKSSKLRLTDLGNLVNAVMAFRIIPQEYSNGLNKVWLDARTEDIVKEFLESLCLVKSVTVGGSIIKALSRREACNLSSPWSERRRLTLCIPVVDWSHLGIASLLHSSPYLESLVISLSYCSDTCVLEHARAPRLPADNTKYYWKLWGTISKCPLLHLKTVKVIGFQVSCGSMMLLFQLLQFLLSSSKALQEIVIQASRYVTRAALDEAMKLLSVPTASPDVVIQFEPPHLWVDPLYMYREVVPLGLDFE